MIDIRPFATLGHADHGWLDARHHFSFANYHDPERMGWGSIRVWNDDTIAARSGFPPHPHRDMEIVTFVRSGAISHRDSLGNEGRTAAGDVQVMSAGTPIEHSEFNREDGVTTLFQIWIEPAQRGISPSYEQKAFPTAERQGQWSLVASQDGRDGSVGVNQDVNLYASLLSAGDHLTTPPSRYAWLHVVKGSIEVNGERLTTGDAAAFTPDEHVELTSSDASEVLLFDLA